MEKSSKIGCLKKIETSANQKRDRASFDTASLVIRPGLDNIVVTKSFSEYCNTVLSVVHELHTAQFQCSFPLFPLGSTKISKVILNDNIEIFFLTYYNDA